MGSPVVFRDLGCTGEDIGRVRASALQTILRVLGGSGGDLFGYVAGLMSTIGCLEGHNVKPVEVAAMREVCRVRGWEVPSEFSLNPPNSPAVLIHWRALIELLGLMPAPRREALCSLRFPVVSSRGSGSSGDYYFDRLSKLLDSPAVTALGEVGIDCSEGAKPFGMQSSTLKWVLALARPYMPLVFHIRASGDSPQAMDALYREVLGLMLDKVPNTLQSIHLHCLNGDEATVKLWLDAYPGTYFGFLSMVKGFGDRQRGGLKAVPGNRLLLESDSPHLPNVAGSINHPARLFRVAEEVARVRGQSPLDILRAGIANGQALYRRK